MTETLVPILVNGASTFDQFVMESEREPLSGLSIEMVQVNIGLRCNLACHHCHVESSPSRTEEMDWPTMRDVLSAARQAGAQVLDITGGAPEMHPHFRRFVEAGLAQGLRVMVRTNLTILLQPGYEELAQFLAERRVHLVASLPCYLPTNVDRQRGRRVYDQSIEAIRRLNAAGYGHDPVRVLDLVYNPVGPSLPPPQQKLQEDYRRELGNRFGIVFNRLYVITNIAIGRFLHDLEREGRAAEYQQRLRDAYNPATLGGLMCRHQLHIGWDGTMYDCDFNYALGLAALPAPMHVREFDPGVFGRRRIATGEHCFACTAGCGSSCGGALV